MRPSSAAAPARPQSQTSTASHASSASVAPPVQPSQQRAVAPADAAASKKPSARTGNRAAPPAEHKILFQKFFKSVGPRTYAAQVKEANNGNHFLVLTEGKRDDASGEVRKTRLLVFSEDFADFFDLLEQTARFIKSHPVPEKVEQRRRRFWAKQNPQPAPAPAAGS